AATDDVPEHRRAGDASAGTWRGTGDGAGGREGRARVPVARSRWVQAGDIVRTGITGTLHKGQSNAILYRPHRKVRRPFRPALTRLARTHGRPRVQQMVRRRAYR